MRQVWEVPGGIHPPENKQQSLQAPLADCPLADEYIVPLNQHIGAPASVCIKVDDYVKKFQLIAEAEGVFSASVHAPTSGTVTAIEERFIPHPSGLKALCIVIKADGQDSPAELTPCNTPFALEHSDIIDRIRSAGLAGMGGAGFPSAVKLNPKSNTAIDTLIINGTECEPYITADDILMQTYADEVIQGTLLLAHTLNNPQNILIGVEDNKPKAIAALQKAANNSAVDIVRFPTKYPSGGEKQLIYILTGQEVESGTLPADIGIVVQNVGTAVAAWRAVRYGEPLIERVTTVVGESLTTSRNMKVRIGTPIKHVLESNGFNAASSPRLIVGGPMMGFAIEQTSIPVIKTTNCLIAPSNTEMPEAPPPQACIRCGHCADACPAGLLPQQLYWYARADDHDKLQNHNLFDCIECGACSYVCPSAIPLVQYYRNAKGTIRQTEADKQKADRARERFERRQERIGKIEAAKEAKRLARKAAAEKNKAKLAQQAPNASDDLVAKAVSAAKAQKTETTPEQERARLARTLESLEARAARTQEQIIEAGEDTARVETLKAKLKQTELKVSAASTKLDVFDTQQASTNASVNTDKRSTANDTVNTTSPKEKVTDNPLAKKAGASPAEDAEKKLQTLKKRLATAQDKWAEAQAEEKPTADALKTGIEKLQQKIQQAEEVLIQAKASEPSTLEPSREGSSPKAQDAASAAIAKAQAKAKATAHQTPEEKRVAAIASLEKRLGKARERLSKAEQENDDNVAAFTLGVEKLEQKLSEAKNERAPTS